VRFCPYWLLIFSDVVEHGWNVVQPEKPCRSRQDSPSPSVDSKKHVDVISISSTASDSVTSYARAGGLRATVPSCALCKKFISFVWKEYAVLNCCSVEQ